jgi:hypothetical protein
MVDPVGFDASINRRLDPAAYISGPTSHMRRACGKGK